MSERLEALARLLRSHSPDEALGKMEALGGAVSSWARRLRAQARAEGLAAALLPARVVSPAEHAALGAALDRSVGLRLLAHRRRRQRDRRAALGRAVGLPLALLAGYWFMTAGLGAALGLPTPSMFMLLPVLLLVPAVWACERVVAARRGLRRAQAEAEVALIYGWAPSHAEGLSQAAELATDKDLRGALGAVARRVSAGEAVQPGVAGLGEPLALCLLGAEAEEASHTEDFAHRAEAQVTRSLARGMGLAAWIALVVVLVAMATTALTTSIGAGTEVPGLDSDTSKQLEDLRKELGM